MDRYKYVQALTILVIFCFSSQLTAAENSKDEYCRHSFHKGSQHQETKNLRRDKCKQSAKPILWSDLSPKQQEWLSKLETLWADMPSHKQQRLANIASRWENASPERKKKMESRRAHWEQRKPKDRHSIRQKFDKFKSLDVEQQKALTKAFEKFKALSPEEKRELRKHWRNMSKEERMKSRLEIMREQDQQ